MLNSIYLLVNDHEIDWNHDIEVKSDSINYKFAVF